MREMPDKCVDLVLTDPPYGITALSWDKAIDASLFWKEVYRVSKDNAAFVLTASQPFTTDLINSNRDHFRYEVIWEKTKFSNPLVANNQILKIHENILIFYRKQPVYNPQKTHGRPYYDSVRPGGLECQGHGGRIKKQIINNGDRYPTSVLKIPNPNNDTIHPTQKPTELFSYFIKTFTDDGGIVLDPFCGSGTIAISCINLERQYIGIEISPEYVHAAQTRIERATAQKRLFV